MKLVELGQKYLQHYQTVYERAHKEQPPANPADPEIRFISFNPSHPALEADILKAIAQCTDLEELTVFIRLNGNLELPIQSQFNALERLLELGDSSFAALNAYRWTIQLYLHPLSEYTPLAKHIQTLLIQFDAENTPPEAYEQLRRETVEQIHQLQQRGIYSLDSPEKWPR